MKVAQLVSPRKWEVIEREQPLVEKGDMLIRIERSAICGTDKSSFIGTASAYPLAPGVPGHEAIGTVEDCPSGSYQPGELVLIWGYGAGLFQELVVVPDEGHLRLPKEIDREVVLMSQLLGTVVHCLYKLGNVIDKRVVILGQGPVGQLFNAAFRNLGASQIIGVDLLDYRLEVGRQMGATHTVNPAASEVIDAVEQITHGSMADIVVEAVGTEETFNQTISLVRRDGTIVFFGIPDKKNKAGLVQLGFRDIFGKEPRFVTSAGPDPQRDYAVALQWIAEGRIDVRPILTHVLPIDDIQAGFEMAFDKPQDEKSIKIVLRF